ncbi:hypothetical protein RJI07_05270 [Mycoplasmatota bacterium WC30]
MNQYDCIVYGNNVYGLTVALYLARKMRKVLVIQDATKIQDNFETMDIIDPENNKYHFEYNPKGIISGMDKSGLMYEYLNDLGLAEEIKVVKVSEDVIVGFDNVLRKRINTFEQYRVYLVRYYPKSRDRIHKFFNDLERHYENYHMQYINMLRNTEYTLTSLMIEWGDYSLGALLDKYFTSEALKNELLLDNNINGLNKDEINSYNFFSNYFIGLKSGFYYLEDSEKDLRDKLIKKLKLINPDIILKTRVKDILKDEDGKIKAFVDKSDKEYYAKFFFVEKEPIAFYKKYFKDVEDDMKVIKSYFPNINSKVKINTMYLAINRYPKDVGINDLIYYFKNEKSKTSRIIKMFNYSLYTKADKRKNQGLLCVDYTYDDVIGASKDDLLKRLYEVFPKLKKTVVGVKEGKPRKHITMLSDLNLRQNRSINEMIEIEAFEHIQVFENLYTGTNLFRPEAGSYGVINQAIMFADKIEDKLYFGEDNDIYHYLSNDEIMTMIKHNFDNKVFGNKEIHVNFHIGKNTYYVKTKGKNVVVHHGKYSRSDLSIYTTNDRLSNLLLKKITFNEVLEEGSLKYRGDKELLFQAVNAFNLDDYQEYNPLDYKKSKYRNLGIKFLFGYFGIYTIAALLSNYINGIYIYPFALGLVLGLGYLKYRSYEEVYWFDIFLAVIFFIGLILSIFWPYFNQLRFDDHLLGIMALTLLISVFVNKPVIYHFSKFDQNIDYRNSTLFKIISNGLTFVWGSLFMTILVGAYITGHEYLSVLYNFFFLGIFLVYYYPTIYVKTNIKR